jgi:hypothetical protein
MPMYSQWFLPIRPPNQNPVNTSPLLHECPMSAHLILLDLITLKIFCEEYRPWSSSICNFLHDLSSWISIKEEWNVHYNKLYNEKSFVDVQTENPTWNVNYINKWATLSNCKNREATNHMSIIKYGGIVIKVFWVVMLCSVWRWRQQGPPKPWYLTTTLHSITI